MTHFYLIRHADKKNEPGDPGLSEVGIEKAKKTAKHIASFPISTMFESPLKRTKETAKIFAEQIDILPIEEAALTERMNWTPDVSFEEFLAEWHHASQNPTITPRFGSSVQDTGKRIEALVQALAKEKGDTHIVLVTHGGTIRDFLYTVSDSYKALYTEKKMKEIHECSITKITVENNEISIEYVNSEEHLR